MRVLMPLCQFFPGGQTTHVMTLAKYLRRAGHEVTLAHTDPGGWMQVRCGEHRSRLAMDSIEYVEARDGTEAAFLDPFRWDVIHAHSSRDWHLAHEWSRRYARPYVLTVHGLGCDRPYYRPYLQSAATVIAVGERVRASVAPWARKTQVIENGVDIELFHPQTKPQVPTVVYASRLDRDKVHSLRLLLAAIRLVRYSVPARLLVVSARPRLSLTREAGEGVVFTGWTHCPEVYINKAHMVVGVGRVIREGLAAGSGCIVNGPGYAGLVRPDRLPDRGPHDFSGRDPDLPAPRPELLAWDIVDFLRLPSVDRIRYERAGRAYALKHFDAKLFAEKTALVYAEVISNTAR